MSPLDRSHAETLYFIGNRRMAADDAQGAEACFREALRLAPDFAEAWGNLGFLLARRGVADEAEDGYRRAIALEPNLPQLHLNLGALLAEQKRFDEAEAAYRLAIQLDPHAPAPWSNLGVLLACLRRDEEAEECYCTALALDGNYAKARFNLSYLLLRQGRYAEGWPCLEARVDYTNLTTRLDCPRWQGEPLAGKSLLIGFEYGHGDMIQFIRCAAPLKEQGVRHITLICHPALKPLFRRLDGVDTLLSFAEPLPPQTWDYWTLPLSLPGLCHTRLETIPASLPYLSAAPQAVTEWAARLPQEGIRVGLAWKGNPNFENDADRSLPSLEVLAPLGKVPGVNFVSLQKGAGEDQAAHPPAGLPLLDLGPEITDFADSAAIVANLDLVICVDTAIAHLAGALGKPVWVMLPDYKTDWRWLNRRSDSLWYPGVMRLFRQREMGNWETVVEEIAAELEKFVAERGRLHL
ncbi:MAG: tetratricopeptide repeat protein [Sulfuricella sp.]|nr:tetratricopeptide repeat protein [Sulfuricella sp.]